MQIDCTSKLINESQAKSAFFINSNDQRELRSLFKSHIMGAFRRNIKKSTLVRIADVFVCFHASITHEASWELSVC